MGLHSMVCNSSEVSFIYQKLRCKGGVEVSQGRSRYFYGGVTSGCIFKLVPSSKKRTK